MGFGDQEEIDLGFACKQPTHPPFLKCLSRFLFCFDVDQQLKKMKIKNQKTMNIQVSLQGRMLWKVVHLQKLLDITFYVGCSDPLYQFELAWCICFSEVSAISQRKG